MALAADQKGVAFPALVEQVEGRHFRASAFGVTSEGVTPEAASSRLRDDLTERISRGGGVIEIHLPDVTLSNATEAWAGVRGMLVDDPQFDLFEQTMRENRERADAEDAARYGE